MRYTLKEILDLAEVGGFAVPAFNVYNLETLMGAAHAAEKSGAPVIFQMYSRLFDTETGKFMAPVIRDVVYRPRRRSISTTAWAFPSASAHCVTVRPA